jgi:hypothetical protein
MGASRLPSRWEQVLARKPVPIIDHLVDEAAKLFAAELSNWPLPLEDVELGGESKAWARYLLPDAPRPSGVAWREAFRLAQWDIALELDAYDEYMRNQRWLEVGLMVEDKGLLLFLSRYVTEQMLALGEATQGRMDRKKKLAVLDATWRQFQTRGALA